MALISIVVPFYNPGKYIKNSVESIKNQSSNNFEVLFINDGSTDNSKDLLINLLKDCNINYRIIDKENGGVSTARNLGIKESKGDYILFFDADDIINKDLIFEITKKLEECKTCPDIIYFGYDKIRENGKIILKYERKYKYIQSSESFLIDLMFDKFSIWTASAIYNRDFLLRNNIHFPDSLSYSEDMVFIFTAFKKAKEICCIPKVLSTYFFRQGSLTFSFSFKVLDTLEGLSIIESSLNDDLKEKKIFLEFFKPKMYFVLVNALLKYDKQNKEIEQKVMDFVNKREVKQEIRKFKPNTFEERAGKMILLISPRIYKFIHDLLYE